MKERREPSREAITHLAYGLYLQRGCEQGRDIEDWVRAEKELNSEGGMKENRSPSGIQNASAST